MATVFRKKITQNTKNQENHRMNDKRQSTGTNTEMK